MPSVTREAVYAALFSLTNIGSLKLRSRIVSHWDNVPPEQQPALFQIQKSELFEQRKGVPALRRFEVEWIVYVNRGGDPNLVPTTILNPILDALEDAIAPGPGQDTQTLGGLVSHAWISGAIETSEGALGPQEVAIIPISILAPPDLKGVNC